MHPRTWLLVCVFLTAVTGCATSGDLEALTERVSMLEARSASDAERLRALESRFDEVASTADRSVERASAAEARARSAEESAADAARKADAIFKKSVSK